MYLRNVRFYQKNTQRDNSHERYTFHIAYGLLSDDVIFAWQGWGKPPKPVLISGLRVAIWTKDLYNTTECKLLAHDLRGRYIRTGLIWLSKWEI
jgi:hypothetical protein